jgi:hypothetical protein
MHMHPLSLMRCLSNRTLLSSRSVGVSGILCGDWLCVLLWGGVSDLFCLFWGWHLGGKWEGDGDVPSC